MSSQTPMESTEKLLHQRKRSWSFKRKLLTGGGIALVIIVALAVGLGVGITKHRKNNSEDDSSSGSGTRTNSTVPNYGNVTMWKPAVGVTWQYVLKWSLNSTLPNDTQVWAIDLFDNSRSTITGLQLNGANVICYFSAGSYEDWRPDQSSFQSGDLGKALSGWAGERWLNVSSPTVRKIMLARIDMAVAKGCQGIDPDNVDGYDNDNGLGLTQAQAIDYMQWMANAAHSRGLSIGLKNAGGIIADVLPYMQWSVNEQCVQFDECDTYAPFIKAGKPVFHVEYPKGDKTNNEVDVDSATKSKYCNNAAAAGFSTIIKNMLLDLWEQKC